MYIWKNFHKKWQFLIEKVQKTAVTAVDELLIHQKTKGGDGSYSVKK